MQPEIDKGRVEKFVSRLESVNQPLIVPVIEPVTSPRSIFKLAAHTITVISLVVIAWYMREMNRRQVVIETGIKQAVSDNTQRTMANTERINAIAIAVKAESKRNDRMEEIVDP